MKHVIISLILVVVFSQFACTPPEPPAEHSPEASLADLKVHEGLEVTLFASEPMFSNPTNMDIDARGRVWITEAYNYRNQYNPKNPIRAEGDRIMILEDTDGDGQADKSKVYYQGTDVNAALGIAVLGNKVIVSCSPHVFLFTDENGDDVPDKKEIIFQGIKGVQHDHAIHAFTFGHDGKLYFNMGNEGGVLLNAAGDTVQDIRGNKVVANGKPYRDGMAMRCDPDFSHVEVLGHNFRNNYELVADPFGTVWQPDNDDDGNKATRVNYVMEFGNFGFKDEMTGASWPRRRTNMEKEIPHRHWHLNDPGVVPNMLLTGAGSPTGILLYEGELLPEEFRGQLIHAEPGHNVVRSYLVSDDGAGYKAEVRNIVEGQNDQWFRPADVTIAPDGSLFVADWYDPGVGGHQVADLDRGRVYRIAPKNSRFKIRQPDVSTPDAALRAMYSPNVATRYLGWTQLEKMGGTANAVLEKAWSSGDSRRRAQAFWLLIRGDKRDGYIQQALGDQDRNIRIMAIRALRMTGGFNTTIAARLAQDSSPQVRREVAIGLRGMDTPEAAQIWTELASGYDKDRWYLEALGIGADLTWDRYFEVWLKKVGDQWNNEVNRDIVWRSRAKAAMPLLAELIKESGEEEMLRYYRAFDFHRDASKQNVLASLITQTQGQKVLLALKHMDAAKLRMTPTVSRALNQALNDHKGSLEFVELVTLFNLKNKAQDLFKLAVANPDSVKGREAMKTLLEWDRMDLIKGGLNSKSRDESESVVKAIWPHMSNAKAIAVMEEVMLDEKKDLELRKVVVKTFRGPWQAEDRLLVLAKENKIPASLHAAAAGVFQTAWRGTLRDEAAKYLSLPGTKAGAPLPKISELVERKGSSQNGEEVFKNLCSSCHLVKGEGTNFGPDLSEIGDKLPKEALYTSILYPSQGISFGYEGYRIKLNDGSTAFGRIVSETAEKIDLQFMQQQQSIEKSDVASRLKVETSLMPDNLQSAMTEQELVDLIEYLAELKKPTEAKLSVK